MWSGAGRRPVYCCRPCKNRAKSAARRGRLLAAKLTCSHEGCERPRRTVTAHGLCSMHYRRHRLGQDLDAPLQRVPLSEHRPCCVEGCDRRYSAKGMCNLHYNRLKATGSVGPAGLKQRAPGTRRRYRDPSSGYVYVYEAGESKGRLEHRVMMEQILGRELLRTETVHHVNGVRDDNATTGALTDFRSGNLELWTRSHPAGQRVADKVAWAIELLTLYAPERLTDHEPKG